MSFQQYGKVVAIYAKRKAHNTDIAVENCKHIPIEIDLPDSRKIISRYLVSQSFQKQAYNYLEKENPDVIYAETLDCLTIAYKYKKKHKKVTLFFEVADLRQPFFKEQIGLKNKIVSSIIKGKESRFFDVVDYLVVTSEKFYEERYTQLISRDKTIFLPNMPEVEVFEGFKKEKHEKFTIGFVGGLRYINQMIMLVDAAEIAQVQVVFSGTPYDKDSQRLIDYCKDREYVLFTGEFNFQKEIKSIYSKLDCVYSVYDAANANVRIALPNKLYEAVLCSLPIIVAKNTYLCELSEAWGVGIGVGYDNVRELSDTIIKLRDDSDYYNSFVENCESKKKDVDYNIYNEKLLSIIKLISNYNVRG